MKLADFKKIGGIVTREPVKKHIVWPREDGDIDFDVFIIRHSYGMIEQIMDGEDDKSRSAHYIAECVRFGEAGNEKMTYDEAFSLDPKVAGLLVVAINEVNGGGKGPKS